MLLHPHLQVQMQILPDTSHSRHNKFLHIYTYINIGKNPWVKFLHNWFMLGIWQIACPNELITRYAHKNGKYAQQLEHSTSQAEVNWECTSNLVSWVNITSFQSVLYSC